MEEEGGDVWSREGSVDHEEQCYPVPDGFERRIVEDDASRDGPGFIDRWEARAVGSFVQFGLH